MKLKYQLLSYAMGAAMGVVMSVQSHATDNVSLRFTGTIKSATCEISGDADQELELGDVSTTKFSNPGDVSTARPFSMVIDCPAGGPGRASVTFSGPVASNPDLLALDAGAGAATGVAVRINESNGTLLKMGTASAAIKLASGANALAYQAQYQSLVGSSEITAGTANATAQYTINYP